MLRLWDRVDGFVWLDIAIEAILEFKDELSQLTSHSYTSQLTNYNSNAHNLTVSIHPN